MEIQQGDKRASYGEAVLEKLSQKLTNEFGKGFSARNLRTMRRFYLTYSIWKTVYSKLNMLQFVTSLYLFSNCDNSVVAIKSLFSNTLQKYLKNSAI